MTHVPLAIGIALSLGSSETARAEDPPLLVEPEEDHLHLCLGPNAGAIRREGSFDSQVGGEMHLAWVRPAGVLAVVGGGISAASFASYDASARVALDVYAGTRIAGVPTGLALGGYSDLFATGRPTHGTRLTLWTYVGVAPYISAGWLWAPAGATEIEIGLRIPFSVWRW